MSSLTLGFCISQSAWANPSTSLSFTYKAASPATSGIEALGQVMTGQPQAIASSTVIQTLHTARDKPVQ